MPRVQWIELEDQPWFPSLLRQNMTEYLEFMGTLSGLPFARFAERLHDAMKQTGDTHLVDLASGGSGPVRTILSLLHARGLKATAQLTDLYPNVEAFRRAQSLMPDSVDFVSTPVDATRVPAELTGFRLMCNSFHHLPPPLARAVLEDAARSGKGIALVEVVGRSLPSVINMLLVPLMLVLFTPFVRPLRLSRFLLTYLLPVIPLCIMFDGVVSCLRVYSPTEMKALTDSIQVPGYVWEMGLLQVGNAPVHTTYLIGRPAPH